MSDTPEDLIKRVFPDARNLGGGLPAQTAGELAREAAAAADERDTPRYLSAPRGSACPNRSLEHLINGFRPGERVLVTGPDLIEVRRLVYGALGAVLDADSMGRCVLQTIRHAPLEAARDLARFGRAPRHEAGAPLPEAAVAAGKTDAARDRLEGWGDRLRIFGPQPRPWEVAPHLLGLGERLALFVLDDVASLLSQAGAPRDAVWADYAVTLTQLGCPVWMISALAPGIEGSLVEPSPVAEADVILYLEPGRHGADEFGCHHEPFLLAVHPKLGALGRIPLVDVGDGYRCAPSL